MSVPAFGIVKDRSELIKGVEGYVVTGGEIKEVPVDAQRSAKVAAISKVLFFPAQHKFYAKNTGLKIDRLRQLKRSIGDITDREIDAMWAFMESRKIEK
jgi:hypothetical protein